MACDRCTDRRETIGVDALMSDPSISRHLKLVLDAWRLRDPVDAARDADLLADVLGRRANRLLGSPS